MAADVNTLSDRLDDTERLYRGINAFFYQEGHVLSGAFCIKARDTKDDAPSVGLARLIPLSAFQDLMNPDWGVSEFFAGVPQSMGLSVERYPDPLWKDYSDAHYVMTGYQSWTNRRRTDVSRQMRDIFEKGLVVSPKSAS
ncbi:MAG: hypothetical protein ABSE28_08700 [Candidatus Sulfotelmatobacter sp.]